MMSKLPQWQTRDKPLRLFGVITAVLLVLSSGNQESRAGDKAPEPLYAAPYLSEPAQAVINAYVSRKTVYPAIEDHDAWAAMQDAGDVRGAKVLDAFTAAGGRFERRPADIPGVDAYWFTTPETSVDGPLLVFTHGGGYVGGSGREINPGAIRIAMATGMRILSVDYRLAPQAPFPAAVEDSLTAYRWLLDNGFDASSIGWFGASAGGGLALTSVLAMRQLGLPVPGAVAVLSPWTDLTLSSESYLTLDAADPAFTRAELFALAGAYHQDADPTDPLVSPVYGDFAGFPPLIIQTGSKEIVLSDSLRVARRARAAGVDVTLDVWDGMWHVFQWTGVPESAEAIEVLAQFFRHHLETDPTQE